MNSIPKSAIEHLKLHLDTFFQEDVENTLSTPTALQNEQKAHLKSIFEQSQLLDVIDAEAAWERFEEKICDTENAPKKRHSQKRNQVLKYAAVVSGIILSVLFLKHYTTANSHTKDRLVKSVANVQLTIEGEKSQVINITKDTLINYQQEQLIAVHDDGVLHYNHAALHSEKGAVMNQVSVPFGKTFKIVLSDGTKVHCDAGTEIRFPAAFPTLGFREIQLSGQAFFEVAKDAQRPFKVFANGVDIRVLGTKFNISAYENDTTVNTLLTEGIVQINKQGSDSIPITLHPGELAVSYKSAPKIKVKRVDPSKYIAWRQGQLYFEQMPFAAILRVLERRFNVSIENNNKRLHRKIFTAKFSDESLDDILKSFQIESDFTFTKKNETIQIN